MIRSGMLFVTVAALALAACGKVGALEQPAPLYGDKAKAHYSARKADAARAAAAKKGDETPERLPPDRIQDPFTAPGTVQDRPIPGARNSPFGAPAQGVFPNPSSQPDDPGPP
ncbi:MAG: hypothetical protein ABI376_08810 [Caulobacteraceae bacterium]